MAYLFLVFCYPGLFIGSHKVGGVMLVRLHSPILYDLLDWQL